MMTKNLLLAGVLAFAMILGGCSSHTVRCDGKLLPINAPAPASKPAQTQPAEATP